MRILTTHTGSLIRPPEIAETLIIEPGGGRKQFSGPGTYAERLTHGVRDIVSRQADIGLDVVDDGEMSKTGWIHYVYARLGGVEPRHVSLSEDELAALLPKNVALESITQNIGMYTPFQPRIGDTFREGTQWVCTGPLVYDPAPVETDIANLTAAVRDVDITDAFLVSLAPGSVYWFRNEYYATEEEFVYAFADAMRTEYTKIVEAGLMLQVDDAVMWHKYGTILLQGGTVDDYNRWASLRVDALNHALAGIPPERIRYHICAGSGHGPHVTDPPLRAVIDHVLLVNAGFYLIEQANARHEHEYHIWEDVPLPEGKVLVPGVVTHHTETVEHPELVAERLVRLAKLVGPESVMAGTDCGFSSSAVFVRVPEWTQWAKLEAVVEGARIASKQLWGAKAEVA